MHITDECPAILGKIRDVIRQAFSGRKEATLVDALRDSGDLVASRVAMDGDLVLGHAALSRLRSPAGGVARAPVAVVASHRRRGIASALVPDCIAIARRRGQSMIFVLGDPDFYGRFGFTAEAARPFASPYAGNHLMAIELADVPLPPAPLEYARAFDDLE